MKKIILILAAMLTFAACTKEGDVIYQTDPADAPSTTPLVTVIYDPNAVGDGNYNDLIYQSVEQAAKEHGLRTMHLSPSSRTEGLAYLETLFQQMSAAQDTVRRLFIVAAASYDDQSLYRLALSRDLRATRRQGLHALPALLRCDVRGRRHRPVLGLGSAARGRQPQGGVGRRSRRRFY